MKIVTCKNRFEVILEDGEVPHWADLAAVIRDWLFRRFNEKKM
jgi:hypothetical protein